MSKRVFRIILPIPAAQYNKIKLTTSNILRFMNRIPCMAEKYFEPSIATQWVDNEMKILDKFGNKQNVQSATPHGKGLGSGRSTQLKLVA